MELLKIRKISLAVAAFISAAVVFLSVHFYPDQNFSERKETMLAISVTLMPAVFFELFCCINTKVALSKVVIIEYSKNPLLFISTCVTYAALLVALIALALYAA